MYLVVNSGRMVQKIITSSGTPFTVAPSNDHTDGSWTNGDLYDGEFGINSPLAQLYIRISGTVYPISLSGTTGATIPSGSSGQTLRYNASGVLVANSVLKNDGSNVIVTLIGGRFEVGTNNAASYENIRVFNSDALGQALIVFRNSSSAEKFYVGYDPNTLRLVLTTPAGKGLTLNSTNGKAYIQINDVAAYDILTLKNDNSSAPVYLVFQNAAGAEKFYAGYRQAQTRYDIMSADNTCGLAVDNNGRTIIGFDNSTYQAPDSGSMLTVDTRSGIGSSGMTLRHVANSGVAAPLNWQYTNSSAALVYYAYIMGDIVSNTAGAHSGKLLFNVAVSGVLTTVGTWSGAALTMATGLILAPGTTSLAGLNHPSGTLKTTEAIGDNEFDGVQFYKTIDTTSGRGAIPVEQYFHLTAAGGTISTIANFFGANSNVSLVANAYYVIDIYCWFLKTSAGTVVWTFTNSAAPTSQNLVMETSVAGGIATFPGTAAELLHSQIYNDATVALALPATASLTTAVNHFMHTRIHLQNGSGTSLKIQATVSAGTITPGINSYWTCRRMSPNNIGKFSS
jgi:hypothetical protein